MRRQPFYSAILIALSLLVTACSRPPSDDTIKSAIAELLKEEVPPSWVNSSRGGKNAQIEVFDIQEIGKFNSNARYWPVRARVKGSSQLRWYDTYTVFDKVGEFQLYQDDYENWKARMNMSQ